jgi:hypothetical protein
MGHYNLMKRKQLEILYGDMLLEIFVMQFIIIFNLQPNRKV